MNLLKQTISPVTAVCLFLIICSTTAISQNPKPGGEIERLAEQIQAAEAKAKDISSSSPELRQAYNEALVALRAAFDAAVEKEKKQVNDLLKIITESAARKPLENYLARLQQRRNKKDDVEPVAEFPGGPTRPAGQNGDAHSAPDGIQIPATISANNDNPTRPAAAAESVGAPSGPASQSRDDGNMSTRAQIAENRTAPGNSGNSATKRSNETANSDTISVIVRDSGTGDPVTDAHVKLSYLKSGDGSPEFVQSDEAFVRTNSVGEAKVRISDNTKTYKIIVQKNGYTAYIQEEAFTLAGAPPELQVVLVPQGKEYYRAIVGFEQSGASSAKSNQNVFLNFFFYRPLLTKNWDETSNQEKKDRAQPPKWGVWGDIRVTSAPQQSQNIFQSFDGGFNDTLKGSVSGLTRLETAASFIAGPQWRIWSGYLGGNWYTVSAIAGGGALTPFSAEARAETFGIPKPSDNVRYDALLNRLIQLDPTVDRQTKDNPASDQFKMKKDSLNAALQGKENISFVIQDRDRFLRNYFAGFRLQIASNDVLPARQMSTFDVTFGQDEAVTAGRFRGGVLRLDGFFPLPLSRSGLIYLFGSASLGFRRTVFSDPLLLPGPNTAIQPTDEGAFVFPLSPANRDLYRFGIGINLVGARLK